MTMCDGGRTGNLPRTLACAALVASSALLALPPLAREKAREPARQAVAPALRWARRALDGLDTGRLALAAGCGRSREAQQLRREVQRLRSRVAELEADLARSTAHASVAEPATEPLVFVEDVPARLLGASARRFLVERSLIDRGAHDHVLAGAWVLDEVPGDDDAVLDAGADRGVRPGKLVASARGVFGRVDSVAKHTSHVRRATAAGYRDLVVIGAEGSRTQGIVEGNGEPLCRIRRVDSTAPVAVGDGVYAARADGGALLYGHIVRAERSPGATYWELWMKPAVDEPSGGELLVRRHALNARRLTTDGALLR